MNENTQDKNIYQKFVEKYPQHRYIAITKALDMSRHQFYRLKNGTCEILDYRKRDLAMLEHFLTHGGQLEDFSLQHFKIPE